MYLIKTKLKMGVEHIFLHINDITKKMEFKKIHFCSRQSFSQMIVPYKEVALSFKAGMAK